jgi:hypothetical protein
MEKPNNKLEKSKRKIYLNSGKLKFSNTLFTFPPSKKQIRQINKKKIEGKKFTVTDGTSAVF